MNGAGARVVLDDVFGLHPTVSRRAEPKGPSRIFKALRVKHGAIPGGEQVTEKTSGMNPGENAVAFEGDGKLTRFGQADTLGEPFEI